MRSSVVLAALACAGLVAGLPARNRHWHQNSAVGEHHYANHHNGGHGVGFHGTKPKSNPRPEDNADPQDEEDEEDDEEEGNEADADEEDADEEDSDEDANEGTADEEDSDEDPQNDGGEAPSSPIPSSAPAPVAAAPAPVQAAPSSPSAPSAGASYGGLWQPAVGSSWQIVLGASIDATNLSPDVDIYDIDLFDTEASTISTLHDKGKKVICYFSAGSWEPNRADSNKFDPADLGVIMQGWESEKWIDVRSASVLNIMKGRIDIAAEKGCDGIDPDNMDGYSQDYPIGFDFTSSDSASYLKEMATYAASKGISTGLKNSAAIVGETVGFTQFSVNEQCHEYSECKEWQPFIAAGKPVFNIEYPDGTPAALAADVLATPCGVDDGGANGFSTVVKTMGLDGWVQMCDTQQTAVTATY